MHTGRGHTAKNGACTQQDTPHRSHWYIIHTLQKNKTRNSTEIVQFPYEQSLNNPHTMNLHQSKTDLDNN